MRNGIHFPTNAWNMKTFITCKTISQSQNQQHGQSLVKNKDLGLSLATLLVLCALNGSSRVNGFSKSGPKCFLNIISLHRKNSFQHRQNINQYAPYFILLILPFYRIFNVSISASRYIIALSLSKNSSSGVKTWILKHNGVLVQWHLKYGDNGHFSTMLYSERGHWPVLMTQ